ncbi:hypothetical protein VCHENC02_0616B, partial [Vibrio harveyi]
VIESWTKTDRTLPCISVF